MKQLFNAEKAEYPQQNVDSTVPFDDEGYDGYTATTGERDFGISTPLYAQTMDELVDELALRLTLYTTKLVTQPDPRDLETFWCFSNWSAAPIEQLHIVAGDIFIDEEPQAPYGYECCMSRELFEWISPCFPKTHIPYYDRAGQYEVIRNLRDVQTSYNRTKKIDNLFTSADNAPELSQPSAD